MKNLSRKIFLAATFLCATTAFHADALLPPFYERLKEFKAVLNSPELAAQLGSADMIEDIQHTNGGFVITSVRHTLKVDVIQEPNEMPGPAKFHLIFHEAEAIE